jgi:hypothetical protein
MDIKYLKSLLIRRSDPCDGKRNCIFKECKIMLSPLKMAMMNFDQELFFFNTYNWLSEEKIIQRDI